MGRDHRRLAAIVSADVAGYSRLMGRDESGTLASVKAHLRELIDPKIAEYSGRTVKTMGDGLLLEFPSVVDAVRCAVDVQRGMAERNTGRPADQRIDFRIGINVGDIIIDGDDIHGDGVNVAARLQSLAEPGGIYVSKVVRDQVLDKLSFMFEELGARQVKNIARPVEVYRAHLGSDVMQTPSGGRMHLQRLARTAPWRWVAGGVVIIAFAGVAIWAAPRLRTPAPAAPVLSVAIAPLTAPRGDAEASRFAEALTRNLTTGLPFKRAFGRLYVVSGAFLRGDANATANLHDAGRRLNVRYVLEGDVLRGGEGNTVNLRLVDPATSAQVWSERDALQDADVAAESSVRVRKLITRVRDVLVHTEMQRVMALPPSRLSPSELVLRAHASGIKDQSLAGMAEALELVDAALRREPDLVPALISRAALINNQGDADPNVDRDRIAREQDEFTARAISIDPTDPSAWVWRAVALAYLGRWDAALEGNAIAIKLDPYEPRWYVDRAWLMVQTARTADALALIDRAMALDPATGGYPLRIACEAYVLSGQTEQAIATCEKASALYPHWFISLFLAAAYANHGDMAKAAAAKAKVMHTVPAYTITQLRATLLGHPEYLKLAEKYWYEGLRKAGFSEK